MISTSSLNHIYRTVWNEALGAMVAVAELAPARGKAVSSACGARGAVRVRAGVPKLASAALAVATAWCATAPIASANPGGATAIHGQASLTANGNQLLVTTQNGAGTNHSAINWQSFSIPAGSSTYFQQPGVNSTSINRVVTNTPSLIFGTLGSNGKLVLVNQSGITVGAGALVDTAGFTASALRMTDADAIAGRLRFGDAGVAAGDVSVQGRILARSGDVVLLGSHVLAGADALVQAPNGNTILAAGQQIEITARGLEGITLQVQAPADSVVNLGSLQGDAVGIFAGTLKHSGNIQATAVSSEGGRVFLKAAEAVTVDGSVTAKALHGVGGAVHATAGKVLLQSGALIDVSGANGGGEALVGGGFHGADARLGNASVTVVESGAHIKADATVAGDGGTVVVWADGATSYQGSINARGGSVSGNGGNAEVSGKKYLDFRGGVDLTAAAGQKGTLLLDPANITINSTGPSDVPGLGSGGLSLTDLQGLDSVLTAAQVGVLLETGNLKLEATTDITVDSSISKLLGATRTGLELHAGRDVNLGFSTIGTVAGPLDVKITADTGSVNGSGILTTAGGKVEVFATSGSIAFDAINTQDFGFVSAGNAGNVTLAAGSSVFVNSITANGANGNPVNTVAGNGGNVVITTTGTGDTNVFPGSVSAYGGAASGYGGNVTAGLGGLINLKALNGNLVFGGSFGSSGSTRNVDTVRMEAPNGSIAAEQYTIGYGSPVTSDIDSGGGAISLSARDAINLSNVGTLQSLGKYQANAGNLTISSVSSSGNIQINTFDGYGNSSSFGGGGAGGDINLSAPQASIVVSGGIDVSGGDGALSGSAGGAGGNVDIVAGGTFNAPGLNNIYSYGGSANVNGGAALGGNGGHINITASASRGGERSSSVAFLDSSGGTSNLAADSVGGDIHITAAHDLFINSGVFTSNGPGSTSGNITVQTTGGAPLLLECVESCTMSGATIRLISDGSLTNNFSLVSDATGDAIVMKANGPLTWGTLASATVPNGRVLLALSEKDVGGNVIAHDFGVTPPFTFKQYNVSYSLAGGFTYTTTGQTNALLAAGPSTGFGLLYTESPTLVASASGTLSPRTYDGTNAANIANAVFLATSDVVGESVLVDVTNATGTYADKNVGVGKQVAVNGLAALVTDGNLGDIPVYGYQFSGQSTISGDITAAPLTLTTQDVIKAYDGTTAAAGVATAAAGQVFGSDTLSGGVFTFSDRNASSRLNVSVSGVTVNDGNGGNNYTVSYQDNTNSVINPATITSIVASREYDGTTVVSSSNASIALTGLVAGETLTVNGGGTVGNKNVGSDKALSGTFAISNGTGLASNYTLPAGTTQTATITPRALSTFVGSGGNWSNAANWDVLPETDNVLAVAIPGAASVTYDAAAGSTTLQSVNSLGAFTMAGGTLGVTQSFNAAQYAQTDGVVNGPGSFTVANSFTQTGGKVAMTGPVSITQTTGDLIVGGVSGSSVALSALNGAVLQTAAVQTPGQLTASATTGVELTEATNSVAKFSATVSGAGNVAFTNTGVLDVTGITVAKGDVLLDNTGAFSSSGAINAPQGTVSIAAHSPLSIGAGVLAGGNIQLAALTNSTNSNIVVNGNLVSTSGGISAQAFNNYVQNGTLNAAQGINVTAGGSISFGPGAFSVGNPVNYTANGLVYTPPWVAATLTGGPTSFVADFLNQFQTALDAQIYAADDPLGKRQLAGEGVVVEGNICPR